MPRRIFIHANNVHEGGGLLLLLTLLKSASAKHDWFATLDSRLTPLKHSLGQVHIKWVTRSILQRLVSEWWIFRHVQHDDVLLCFGNLPPLFRSRGRVTAFVQNRYLVEPHCLQGHSAAVSLRIRIERWWLITFTKNVDLFVVQTPTMKLLLQQRIERRKAVAVFPFVGSSEGYARSAPAPTESLYKYDFVYIASGEPHKNHRNLIEAWCLLAQNGTFPSLCLTIDEDLFPDLCHWLRLKRSEYGLRVENFGSIKHEQVKLLYGQSRALVFASLFESFGLPLIEARQACLPVLAPELDYVRDVLDPNQVFDAVSPISIARAVKRFLCLEEPALRLLDGEGFINQILFRS